MINHPAAHTDDGDQALERALRVVGQRIAFPPTPDLAGSLRATLESEASPDRPHTRSQRQNTPFPRRVFFTVPRAFPSVGLALIIASIALTTAAIAQSLGILGVRITWLDETLPSPPAAVGATLALGREVTLEEVLTAVDFVPSAPSIDILSSPPTIYLSGNGPDAMISFVYPATPDLPASDESGVGALLTQFAGQTERPLVEKGLVAANDKDESQTRLDAVTVNNEPGYWISGAPHAVFFVCSGVGDCRQEPYRLAGDVLLWVQNGVTLRLESGLSQAEAIQVAESVRPLQRRS